MNIKLVRKLLALIFAAILTMLPFAGAAKDNTSSDPDDSSSSEDTPIQLEITKIPVPVSQVSAVVPSVLVEGKEATIAINSVDVGYEPLVTITMDGSDEMEIRREDGNTKAKKLVSTSGNVITVETTWETDGSGGEIILSARNLVQEETINVVVEVEEKEYTVKGLASTNAKWSSDDEKVFGSGDPSELISVTPSATYKLTKLVLNYGGREINVLASGTYGDSLSVKFNSLGETTISGPIFDNLEVQAFTESTTPVYDVRIYTEDGISLKQGSSAQKIDQGGSLSVRVEADEGYLIDNLSVRYGSSYASWSPGQSYFQMGLTKVRVTENNDGRRVSFTLDNITTDIELEFTAGFDNDNIPITISEGSRINIDTDCGSTVREGEDVTFNVWTTSSRYSVRRITLTIGNSTGSGDPEDDDYIRVGNRRYDMEIGSDGEVTVYVDNVTAPVRISATSYSNGSSYDSSNSRPTVTVTAALNLTITKSVDSSRVREGDDVTFYFTPRTGYEVEQITLTMGTTSRSAHGDDDSITILNRTYDMYQDPDGRVVLYVTDIDRDVKVTGRAAVLSNNSNNNSNSNNNDSNNNNSSNSNNNSNNNNNSSSSSGAGPLRLNSTTRIAFLQGYQDGTFRPKASITRGETAQMLYRLTAGTISTTNNGQFNDVPANSWYSTAICGLANAGVIDSGGYFWPDASITRAELCNMLYRLAGSPRTSGEDFTDTSSHRYVSAIRYCSNCGWINGYQDGTFRPDNFISRAEVAALMVRALGRSTATATRVQYLDVPQNYWAYPAICAASTES